MSETLFYTTSFLDKSPIITSAATGSGEKQNMLDTNLNVYWEANAGNPAIVIDTFPQDEAAYAAGKGETSGSYDAGSIWIKNYNTDFTATSFNWHESYDSGDSNLVDVSLQATLPHLGGPLYFVDFTEKNAVRRYIRLVLFGLDNNMQIGYIALHNKRTLKGSPHYPIKDTREYYNTMSKMRGGQRLVSAEAGNKTTMFDQKYTLIGQTAKDTFDNIFDDSRGSLNPFIYQPGTVVTDAFYCRMDKDKEVLQERYNQYWLAATKFKSLPFIKAGDSF